MTHGALRVSAIALGAAAFVSLASLTTASADDSAPNGMTSTPSSQAATPSGATATPNAQASSPSGTESTPSGTPSTTSAAQPSLSEPAPTPGWAEGGPPPSRATAAQTRHYRHYAWRNGHRYVYYSNNPVANAATGVVGTMADLGSIAAYPIYCFPRYGSCPVYRPYR
jgi:hypothetical protein